MQKIALFIIVSIAFIFTLSHAMDKQEVYECHKLASQSKDFPLFYLTQWQADMCDAHNIAINAPIK
jgi:hypothetical protein